MFFFSFHFLFLAIGDATFVPRLHSAISLLTNEDHVYKGEVIPRASIQKPLTDKREYVYTQFESGMHVIAVQDLDAKTMGFAVAVDAGSLENPPQFQGLAHFCEHMLFLGSEKYPDTDAFSKQMALYGGKHNAFTATEDTVYFNEIGSGGVTDGLDIFAQFFISPSFDSSMVDKEIYAVNSEHEKNKPETLWRMWYLILSHANPKNPIHGFSTGNLETLKIEPEAAGLDLVEGLKTFHKENYCARRLHLVLVSNRTTNDMLDLAHKHFDAIPKATSESCPTRPEYFDKVMFSHKLGNLGRQYSMSTNGSPELWLMFPIPPLKKRYKVQAEAYLWHALDQHGQGSLQSLLDQEELSSGYFYDSDNSVAGSVLLVVFALTDKGARHIDKILEHFFGYLKVIRDNGVNKDIIASLRQLRQVLFDYSEKSSSEFNFARELADASTHYDPEDILTGGSLIEQMDINLTKQILNRLVPDNMNMAVALPSLKEVAGSIHEPHYDFYYNESAIDSSVIARLQKVQGSQFVPPPDLKYVPHKLGVTTENAGDGGPKMLLKEGRVESWWLGIGTTKLPKALINVKVAYPSKLINRVEDSVLATMHSRLVERVLAESSNPFKICGLSFSTSASTDGLEIAFSGFDEHILELIQLVLPQVRAPNYTKDQFEMERRQLLLELADVTTYQPYQHAIAAFQAATVKGHYTRDEAFSAVQNIDLVSQIGHQRFLKDLRDGASITLLFTGNINEERALSITSEVESLLEITRKDEAMGGSAKLEVLNPKEEIEIRIPNPINGDVNSATIVYYQFGNPTIADRVHLSILSDVISEPVFDTLRTQRQLGYVVDGTIVGHESIAEICVIVQGSREDPDVVGELIEQTVQNLTAKIGSMGQTEFEARKRTLRTALEQKDTSMAQAAGRYWGQITGQTYCFNKRELELKYLDSEEFASPAPLLEAWTKTVAPSASRRKISVKLFGGDVTTAEASEHLDLAERKVLTQITSASLAVELAGEATWPHIYICDNPDK